MWPVGVAWAVEACRERRRFRQGCSQNGKFGEVSATPSKRPLPNPASLRCWPSFLREAARVAQAVGNQWQPRPRCSTTPSPSSPELNRTGQERPPPLLNIVIRLCSRTGGPPPPHTPPGQSQAGSCCSAVRGRFGRFVDNLAKTSKEAVNCGGQLRRVLDRTNLHLPPTSVLGRPKLPLPCR